MKYRSSRGKEEGLSFEQVLFSGYSSDGGVYFPESIPRVESSTLEKWSKLSYKDLVKEVVKAFVSDDEIPADDLSDIVDGAFVRFTVPEVIAFHELEESLTVAELFHGPTLAFKDLALSVVGQLYSYFLEKRKKHMTILVGTSGDTGSAAIEAVRGKEWLDIVVLLPQGRCTKIQELQMTTVLDDNVHNFCVDGTSDELDVPCKQLFADWDFVQAHNVCSINSVNWARVLVQAAHYIYIHFRLAEKAGTSEIVIPTGACGNIAAGCVAYKMGVPLRLVAAVNENDIVSRFVSDGDFSVSPATVATWASAMDIQIPYNVERILLAVTDVDIEQVAGLMTKFDSDLRVNIPSDIMKKVRDVITDSASVSRAQILAAMKKCHSKYNYLPCPHTAVGLHYIFDNPASEEVSRAVIATAAPHKFPEAITAAGIEGYTAPASVTKLAGLETKYQEMKVGQDWLAILLNKIRAITEARKEG